MFDDGIKDTAAYIANAMKTYTDIEISFAVRTDAFGSFVKNGDDYVIDENGKYTFTQSSGQIRNTAFWIDESTGILNMVDENGNILRARIEMINHSHSHGVPADGNNHPEIIGSLHIIQSLFGFDSEAFIIPGFTGRTEEYDNLYKEHYLTARGLASDVNVERMLAGLEAFAPEKRGRVTSYLVRYNDTWLDENGAFPEVGISAEEALRLDENGKADVSHVEDFLDAAMASGKLAAFYFHGIKPSTYLDGTNITEKNELHIYEEQADAIFAYVQKYAETGELWSTTYSTASKYYCSWYSSELDVRNVTDNLIAVSLTDAEDNDVCDEALTVKVPVSDSWDSVLCNGESLEIKGTVGAKYVLVNVVPDSGIVYLING